MQDGADHIVRSLGHVWCRLCVAGLAGLVFTTLAMAQTLVDPQQYDLNLSKGIVKFNQGRYEDAEAFFNKALDAKPGDPDAEYYLGQTLIRTKKFQAAENLFRSRLEADPSAGKIRLGLGVAQFYQGKYQEALDTLTKAEADLPNDPLVYYFQGLAHNRLGAYDKSPPLLTKAMLMSPDLAPEGHYQRGIAHYSRGVYDEAKAEFEAAIAAEPDSDLAQSARQYLRQIKDPKIRGADLPGATPTATAPAPTTGQLQRRWDASFSISGQYDSNVVLLPLGIQPPGGPSGISRKDDFRTVFFGRGEYRFLQNDTWTVGSGYSLYQSFHRTLSGFDVQDHSPMLYVQHRSGRVQSRLDYIFDYVNVGRSPFLISHAVRPVFTVREGDRWFTQVQLGYQNKDFQHGRFLLNSTRDAKNWLFGVTQFMHFSENRGVARVGYIFDSDRTGGGSPAVATPNVTTNADWAYTGHHLTTGVTLPPVYTLVPDLTFDYFRQNYDNPNSFSPDGRTVRADDIFVITAGISRNITSFLALGAQYSYTRDKSNVDLFNYERHVYSITLSGTF